MRFYWPIAKVDADERMVWGYASTEAVDDQGETVTRAALAAALDDYMRFANIREMHRNSAVGVATAAEIDDRGLYLAARIVDDDAWKKVAAGVYKGFSIGGRVTARAQGDRRTITGLQLNEISVVDRPANPEAVFDCWKRAAAPEPPPPEADPHERLDYADPGYQPDGRPRYPLDSPRHIRAAWAYIHQAHNQRPYTPAQLQRIKARILAAWRSEIDPKGPPGAAPRSHEGAQKGLVEIGRLAQLIAELDWLQDRIAPLLDPPPQAGEGRVGAGDDSPVPARLEELIAELCDALAAMVAEEAAELVGGGEPPLPAVALLSRAGRLRKVHPAAGDDGLAKLAGEILPRLDRLQQRVEEIARTPLPAQTAARGLSALAKGEDGDGAAPRDADIVAALARMSDEERTLTLIKAAHAAPLTALSRR